jgi:RsiW-degrading membrane proteinase PrsW (M82 family)
MLAGLIMENNIEDEIEKEKTLIFLIPAIIALVGGIVSAVLIALPLSYLLTGVANFGPVVIAPLVEEPSKIVGVILLALYYPNSINNKKRGLVLGIMAGIGFAFTENLVYYLVYPQAILARAVVPVLGHICASAIAALGVALLSKKLDKSLTGIQTFKQLLSKEPRAFIIIAMLFHSLNNLVLIIDLGAIFWILNLVVGFFILSKLYAYIPEHLTGVKISGTLDLLSKAIFSKHRKHEHQTKIIDYR